MKKMYQKIARYLDAFSSVYFYLYAKLSVEEGDDIRWTQVHHKQLL